MNYKELKAMTDWFNNQINTWKSIGINLNHDYYIAPREKFLPSEKCLTKIVLKCENCNHDCIYFYSNYYDFINNNEKIVCTNCGNIF